MGSTTGPMTGVATSSPGKCQRDAVDVAEVGILLYDGVEVLDCCGPFEVFSTAARVALRRGWAPAPFKVHTIALSENAVVARGGLCLVPSCTVEAHPPLDILIVPGGLTEVSERRRSPGAWLAKEAESADVTASVCTGAFLLATARLLDGREATSHWEDVDDLQRRFPEVKVRRTKRWVDQGRVVTSAGISAGIDMSLHLVRRQEGEELAKATARQMEYDWKDDE